MKGNNSSGYDKISAQFVKDAREILCNPLAAIFHSSFKMGIFPAIWKIARINSIFKSGSKSDMGNYRPISVLSVFSRLLEKLGHDQVSYYMKEQKNFTSLTKDIARPFRNCKGLSECRGWNCILAWYALSRYV